MIKKEQLTYQEALEELKGAYERDIVYYKAMITTHEVTIGQQSIQLKKAQEVVEDNVQTILRLQEEAKDLGQVKSYLLDERDSLFNALIVLDPGYVPDSVPLDVQGGVPLHNPDILQCELCAPEPHPYTHPIRKLVTDKKLNGK